MTSSRSSATSRTARTRSERSRATTTTGGKREDGDIRHERRRQDRAELPIESLQSLYGLPATFSKETTTRLGGFAAMNRFRIGVLALTALSVVLVWALPAVASPTKAQATAVTVTAGSPSEFKFKLSKAKIPHGAVTFTVKNVAGPRRLQDRRQEDQDPEPQAVADAESHLQQGRQVQVRLHRPDPRDARHVGQSERSRGAPKSTVVRPRAGASSAGPRACADTSLSRFGSLPPRLHRRAVTLSAETTKLDLGVLPQ